MKFILMVTVCNMMAGYVPRVTIPSEDTFDTRAACIRMAEDTQAGLVDLGGKVYIEAYTCIQLEGAVKKYPVLIERVEEADRV